MELIKHAIQKLGENNIAAIDLHAHRINELVALNASIPIMAENDKLSYISVKGSLRGYLRCLVDFGILNLDEYLEIYFYVKAGKKLEELR